MPRITTDGCRLLLAALAIAFVAASAVAQDNCPFTFTLEPAPTLAAGPTWLATIAVVLSIAALWISSLGAHREPRSRPNTRLK